MSKQAKLFDRKNLPVREAARELGLGLLEAIDDGLIFLEGTRRFPRVAAGQGMEGLRRVYREEESRRVAQRLRDLRRRGHAVERKIGHRLILALTEKGRIAKLRLQIRGASKRRDGKILIVAFDIPEHQAGSRNTLRHLLRSCGFFRLQDSLWVTDREAENPLSAWLAQARSSDWVRVFLAEEL